VGNLVHSPRALAAMAVALLVAPTVAQAVCPPSAVRPGLEIVNPYVTPFVYSANNSTFEAYRGFGPGVPPNASSEAMGSLAAAFDYGALALQDDVRWGTDENINESAEGLEWQAFAFFVSPALSGASSIVFEWNGYGAFRSRGAEQTYLFAYNFAEARWDILAQTGFSISIDKDVTGEVSKNVSSYVSGNRIVVMVGSEQGPPDDIGMVGRPGGRPVLTTYIETDYVEVRAFLPAILPALPVPHDYLGTLYGRVTFRGPTVIHEGDITVASGGTLELDHARLVMNGTDAVLRVEAGGSLRVLNGSVITDAPMDTDDGGPSDRHYWIEVLSGGEIAVVNSTIENAGAPGGPWRARGVYLENATGVFCNARVLGPNVALVADRLANVSVTELWINNSGGVGSDLQLVNESVVDALGLNFTRLAISPDSTLVVRTAIGVSVVDAIGKPIRGADLRMTDDNVTAYASAGYGGNDARTSRVTDFDDTPLTTTLGAVDRVYLGQTTATFHATQVSAKYFEWSETRTVSTAAAHTETFVMTLAALPFQDLAALKGYDAAPRNFSTMDSFGPGVSIVDFDMDGRLDIFVAGGATRGEAETASASANRLYRQEADGRFTDMTDAAGLTSKGSTAATWGDFDNNGFPDVFLVYQGYGTDHALLWPGTPDALYRNNGDLTFTNVTSTSGVGERGHGSSAAWGDFDGDGWLDLYVGNIGWVLAWLVRNESSTLYRNNRDGTFTDVTSSLGVNGGVPGRTGAKQTLVFLGGDNATERALDSAAGSGFVQAVAWVDYDRDGDLDLFLAEDFGASVLYRNDAGTFTLVTQQAGLRKVGSARGVQVLDIDGDGWLDILQANRWIDFVWRNNRDGTFTDIAASIGLDEELPGTTPVPLDIDLDGKLDLFVGGGRTSTFHAYAPAFLWHNRGAARFADITAASGVATGNNRTMGAASGDLDGDGDPDLVTGNADRPSSLFMNQNTGGTWLKVRLQGTVSPRDGQGAQVRLLAPGAGSGQVQQVGSVGARGSGQPFELIFGLNGAVPSASSVWRVEVLWTSGISQTVSVTSANQVLRIVEQSETSIQPIAPFTVAEDVEALLAVQLISGDPRANATANVTWTLPTSEGPVTLAGLAPRHTFETPGRIVGTVTVRDRSGHLANATVEITVADTTAPSPGALPAIQATAGEAIMLVAANASDNDPEFNATGLFVWTFTEGGAPVSLDGRSAAHAFAAPGDYELTLTVRDAANNTAAATFTVTVQAPAAFGAREAAIAVLILAAAAVMLTAIHRSQKRKQLEAAHARDEAEAATREQAARKRAEKKKSALRKRMK